jgi:DNA-binding CsgD family transcriptional regulator
MSNAADGIDQGRRAPHEASASTGRRDPGAPPESVPGRGLVGRGQELGVIADMLAHTGAGQGGVVIVEGEPGVGKTALLDEVVQETERAQTRVLTSTANELDMRMPFAAIRSWLPAAQSSSDSTAAMIERARALLRGEGAGDAGAIAWEASVVDIVVDIVESLCATGPITLLMDDAHWADRSSLRAVARLHEVTDELPVLIVLALRPLPHIDALTALLDQLAAAGVTRITLGPLAERDGADLASDMLGAPVGPALARALSWTAGNPLFITELVAGLQQAGQLTALLDGTVELTTATTGDDPRLPTSLTEAILRRLDYLPTNVRRVLSLAAALGASVEAGELTTVLGAEAAEIDNVIKLATQARVLSPSQEGLARPSSNSDAILTFRHDLIRRVFAAQVPRMTQASLQAHAAQTLMSAGGPVERIAEYLISGDVRLDPNGIAWLMKSANRLIICAPENAVRLLSDAIGSTTDTKSSTLLRILLVRALLWDGRAAEAENAAREALERVELRRGASDQFRNVLLLLLSMACMAQGKVQAAHDVSISAVREESIPPHLEARHQGMLALESLLLENVPAAEHAAERAETLGREISDPVPIGMAGFALGFARYYQCHLDEGLRLGDNLIQQYESRRGGDGFSHFNPYTVSGYILLQLDRPVVAELILTAAIDYEDRNGGTMQTANLIALGLLHFVTGRWDDASAVLARCVETADVLGFASIAPTMATVIAICRGLFDGTPESIPKLADDIGARTGAPIQAHSQALALESHGRPAEALDLLMLSCAEAKPYWTDVAEYYIYPDMARLAMLTGRSADLRSIASYARIAEARIATPSRRATALLCTGLATRDPAMLTESAELFTTTGRPMYTGIAYENLAAVRAQAGQTASARTALDAAVELYSGLETEWLIARAEAWLRRLGLRHGARGPRKRPKTGWAALTPSELRVAEFVTQGMSNSQIASHMLLSRRTIQTHVSSILTKLDVDTRVQIALSHAHES